MALGLIRAVELQRVATWMLEEALADIDRMQRKMRSVVMDAGFTGRRTSLSDVAIERQVKLELEDLAKEIMAELARRIVSQFKEIAEIQRQEEKNNLLAIYGIAATIPDSFTVRQFLINGATIPDQVSKVRDDLIFRIMSSIRDSNAAGKEEEEMWMRIRGTKTDARFPGEFQPAKRAVETVVRTGVTTVQAQTQLSLDLSTKAPKHAWQHISVLDNRTTDICRSRAWKKWDSDYKPIGHSMPFAQPPLHANCRSKILLIFVDDEAVAPVSFSQWIEQLTAEQQRTIFGEDNLRRWKANRISDADLIRQSTRPMTIDQLRQQTENRQGRLNF